MAANDEEEVAFDFQEKITGAKKRKTKNYKPPGSQWTRALTEFYVNEGDIESWLVKSPRQIPRTPRSRFLYDKVRQHFQTLDNSAPLSFRDYEVNPPGLFLGKSLTASEPEPHFVSLLQESLSRIK